MENNHWFRIAENPAPNPEYDCMRQQRTDALDARGAVNLSLLEIPTRTESRLSYTQGEPGDF